MERIAIACCGPRLRFHLIDEAGIILKNVPPDIETVDDIIDWMEHPATQFDWVFTSPFDLKLLVPSSSHEIASYTIANHVRQGRLILIKLTDVTIRDDGIYFIGKRAFDRMAADVDGRLNND
jgi:hypothetical protein